ncbi:hypothetical protein [Streptomyces erythrochromogenes]|uniref:hypothetical protein n=1 Tax=Streptomyces erythrochromogenes TaxID=285574 RepID=UPI0036FCA4B0
MDSALKALGAAYEGSVGVLLADGSEPGPVYFDVGSGPTMPSSAEWHAYDGRHGRPRAALLRGSCSCGWRGVAEYPLDWATLPKDAPLYEADVDLSGPVADYGAHLSVIRDGTVQLTDLVTELVRQLNELATDEPLVALKAPADLRYIIAEIGQEAAFELAADDIPIKQVATALDTNEAAARNYLSFFLWFGPKRDHPHLRAAGRRVQHGAADLLHARRGRDQHLMIPGWSDSRRQRSPTVPAYALSS